MTSHKSSARSAATPADPFHQWGARVIDFKAAFAAIRTPEEFRDFTGHWPTGLEAARFLQRLRPGGPWVLTAIDPDKPGGIRTITAEKAEEVRRFVEQYDGERNLYFSTNPTRTPMTSKASKADIAAVEFILSDLDPADDETPEEAKARYQKAIEEYPARPAFVIDSGNGLQVLYRLDKPVEFEDGTLPLDLIADVEARIKALMGKLGAVAGTQNIDRILRLPGTTNLPNAAKRARGRVACPTALLRQSDATCRLEDFPKPEAPSKQAEAAPMPSGGDPLDDLIHGKVPKGKRSECVFRVVCEMLRRGYRAEAIEAVLLDKGNAISEHVYDQGKPQQYAARQVTQAIAKIDFAKSKKYIIPNSANIRIAMLKLGVTVGAIEQLRTRLVKNCRLRRSLLRLS
jgi:hypothetical protein